MTIWPNLLADIRSELKDSGLTPRWTDRELYLYAKDAILDYSTWFPRRIDRTELTLINGAVTVPANFVEDILVEYPLDTTLERRVFRPGAVFGAVTPSLYGHQPGYYYIQGGNLYVCGLLDQKVFLTYMACHSLPTSETDALTVLSLPDIDAEIIRTYMKWKCYGGMRARQASLDRFKPVGTRTDNPLTPETENLYEVYLQMIAQRTPGGIVILYKTGQR
jgi:hypothetical protein